MKKAFPLFLLLNIAIFHSTLAQNEGLKSYYDLENGYKGAAGTIYLGEENEDTDKKVKKFNLSSNRRRCPTRFKAYKK